MFIYTTISSDSGTFRLSALHDKNEYVMPSLQKEIDGEEIFFWDNSTYLKEELYSNLKMLKDTKEDPYSLFEGDILLEDVEDLINLLEKGIELKFFEVN